MRRTTFAALLSMGALAFVPAADAGSAWKPQATKQGTQGMGSGEAAQQASRITTVRGDLIDLRTARLRQDSEPHLLARVRLASGRTAVIDLGRAQAVRDQNVRFRRGEPFEAQGVTGRINQRPVLVAQRFRPQGQRVFQVARVEARSGAQQRTPPAWSRSQSQPGQQTMPMHRTQQARQSPAARATYTVRGKVLETRELKLKGIDERHNFAKIRTDDGRIAVVDLGPSRALEGLVLDQGERAIVRGTSARINGRPVLVARDVAQVASLERSDFVGVQAQPSGQATQQETQQESPGSN